MLVILNDDTFPLKIYYMVPQINGRFFKYFIFDTRCTCCIVNSNSFISYMCTKVNIEFFNKCILRLIKVKFLMSSNTKLIFYQINERGVLCLFAICPGSHWSLLLYTIHYFSFNLESGCICCDNISYIIYCSFVFEVFLMFTFISIYW